MRLRSESIGYPLSTMNQDSLQGLVDVLSGFFDQPKLYMYLETRIQSATKFVSSLLAFISVTQDGQVETPDRCKHLYEQTSFSKTLFGCFRADRVTYAYGSCQHT